MFLAWHFVRYFRIVESDSLVYTPDMLPAKQEILVNEKTQVGGLETKRWIEKMPSYSEYFNATYVDTSKDVNNFKFQDDLFTFSTEVVNDRPWSAGAY